MGMAEDKELCDACENGEGQRAIDAVRRGANVNATGAGDPPLVRAANKGHALIVEWLLDNGADPNIVNTKKSTPLMCAAFRGNAQVVALLMERGADTKRVNNDNKTAMAYARDQSHANCIRALKRLPDEVSNVWQVDDRFMQEIYDFKRLERVTFVRKSEAGEVEALQREAFSQLPDRGALQKAFDEHRRRGGKRSEEEVFDCGLGKLKLAAPVKGR
jgi:ankyrin repeat protein